MATSFSTHPDAALCGPPPRLHELVLATPPQATCILSTASGYGRTLLLQHVVAGDPTAIWVTLDRSDSSDRLTRRLLSATRGLPSDAPPPSTAAEPDDVISALHERAALGPFWLVVDCLDVPSRDGLAILAHVARSLPPQGRLAISTRGGERSLREDLRNSPVEVLDEGALAWTTDEVAEAIGIDRLTGDSHEVDSLLALIGGWPAAVTALVQSEISGAATMEMWLRTTACDALLGDWWSTLGESERRLLVDTSVLDRLSGGLCDVVRQASGSDRVLSELVDRHQHLMPVQSADLTAEWERLPMLTAFLRRRPPAPADERARHAYAAEWYASRSDDDAHIRHLIGAGQINAALARINSVENAWFEKGQGAAVLQWYQLMPTDALDDEAELTLREGWAKMLSGSPAQADALVSRLNALLAAGASSARHHRLLAEADLLAAAVAGSAADPEAMHRHAAAAVAQFGDDQEGNGPHFAPLLVARALLWMGKVVEARTVLDATGPGMAPSPLLANLVLRQLKAAIALTEGDVRHAHRLATEAVTFAEREGIDTGTAEGTAGRLTLAMAAFDLDDLAACEYNVLRAQEQAQRLAHAGLGVFALVGLARLAAARSDIAQALDWLRSAHELLDGRAPGSPLRRQVALTEIRLRIAIGDPVRAERLLDRVPAGQEADLLAVRLAQLRRPGSGLDRLDKLSPTTRRASVELHVLRAEALALRSTASAQQLLLDVADEASESGLLRCMSDISVRLRVMGDDIAGRRGHEGLRSLLRAAPRTSTDDGITDRHRQPTSPLSAGEIQLVELLPSRATNQEIADQLSVSVNTIKTRLRRLYAKLDVTDRDHAIRRARQLGLLQASDLV